MLVNHEADFLGVRRRKGGWWLVLGGCWDAFVDSLHREEDLGAKRNFRHEKQKRLRMPSWLWWRLGRGDAGNLELVTQLATGRGNWVFFFLCPVPTARTHFQVERLSCVCLREHRSGPGSKVALATAGCSWAWGPNPSPASRALTERPPPRRPLACVCFLRW